MKRLESNGYGVAADETLAYDLVEMLIKREGVGAVLATLRAWYVLLDMTPKGEKSPKCHAFINDV